MPKFQKYENRLLALALLSILALAMASCDGCQPEPAAPTARTTVRFWHTFNEAETRTTAELVAAFERERPDVRVEVTVLAFGAARNRLRESIHGGAPPDLARAEVAWIHELAADRMIDPVSAHVDLDTHIKAVAPFVRVHGQVYAFPQSIDCLVLFYNRDHLKAIGEAPPATLNELVRVGSLLTVDSSGRHVLAEGFEQGAVARYGFYFKGDGYTFLPILWAHGGDTVDPARGVVSIDREEAVEAANFVLDLEERHGIIPDQPDFSRDYEEELRRFGDGEISMIFNGPWAMAEILAGRAFEDPTSLGVAPVPRGSEGQGGSPVGGHAYVVPATSANKEAALALAAFLTSPASQRVYSEKNNILPTRRALFETSRSHNRLDEFRAALTQSHDRAIFKGMARLFDALTPAIQRVMRGEISVVVALQAVAEEWRQIIGAARDVAP